MNSDNLVVAWHKGEWRIAYDGQWFGPYQNKLAAAVVAIRIARTDPVIKAFGKQRALPAIHAFNKAPHPILPQIT